ncbi:hypothetical protein C8R44DRAFT_895768 [Mycena epipterygia]|nr:hypothetical protein C8R44DRAFT_895768 [Mycena epipterygia]
MSFLAPSRPRPGFVHPALTASMLLAQTAASAPVSICPPRVTPPHPFHVHVAKSLAVIDGRTPQFFAGALRPRLHHAPASPASTGASPLCLTSPSLQIPRDVYDWRVAGVHDKDRDVSAKNTASDAANAVADSHAADKDRPTVDKTQTSICPPRLVIDWSGKRPAVPFHAWTRIAPPYARIGTISPYAWTSTTFVCGLCTMPPPHSPPARRVPALPPRDIFLSSSRGCLCAFNKPCETSSAFTSAYSPPRVCVLPSSSTATFFLPPGPASAYAFDTPQRDEQRFLLRSDISRPSVGSAPSTEELGQRPAREA